MFLPINKNCRKNGFLLPITMILISFGTVLLLTAGIYLSRTSNNLKSFNSTANKQIVVANVVEIAANSFFNSDFDNLEYGAWEGYDDLKEFVTTRSGYEGTLWGKVLDTLGNDDKYIDFTNALKEAAYAEIFISDGESYDLGAVVHSYGDNNKYLVIGWASSPGRTKRYAIALITVVPPNINKPAIRLGEINRIFSPMHSSSNGNSNGNKKINGDMIYGNAVIIDDVKITETATLTDIFKNNVVTQKLNGDNAANGFIQWNGESKEASLTQWKEEYLAGLPGEIIEFDIDTPPQNLEDIQNEILVINPPIASLNYNPVFKISFDTNGLSIICKWYTPNNNNKYIEHSSDAFNIAKDLANGDRIHIQINGDVEIGTDQHHKTEVVNGKYVITVYGDINITSNIFYEDIFSYINNGEGNSPVANKSKDVTEDLLAAMIDEIKDDYLGLAAIGGDMNFNFNHSGSAHGNRSVIGDLMAFEENGFGGNMGFPGFQSAVHGKGHTPQFFAMGSLTAAEIDRYNDWGGDLSSLVIAAIDSENDSNNSETLEFKFSGMRVW